MRIEIVYDLDMYQWLLKPIHEELLKRGHEVEKARTRSDPKRGPCDGSIAIQNVAYENSDPARPRFFINHGSSASKSWGLNMPIDYFVSPSPYWTRQAKIKKEKNGHAYQVIGDFGYPRMDVLVDALGRKKNTRALMKELYSVDDRPLVLCFPTYKKPGMEEAWLRSFDYRELVKRLDPHYNLVVCPHQMDDTGEFENILQPWQVFRSFDIDRLLLFAAADVIVSDTSGAAYEACGLDIPVVLTEGVHKLEAKHQEVDLGPVAELDNVAEAIDSQLRNPKEYRARREFWAEYILGPCDGKASARIVDALEAICPLVR